MPGIVTRKFRLHNAQQFYESLSESSPTRYYAFIGRITSWPSESAPPTPTDTVQNTEFAAYRDMIAMKRINASDASHVATRRDWATSTVFAQYDDAHSGLFANNFYTITEDNNVYKCIDNNGGGTSTVKPTGTGTSITTTSDGYRWKYLYTIGAAEALKFLTTSFMPVKTLAANDGSGQWTVQQAAANGAIHHVVPSGGTGYAFTSNTFASVANGSTMTLNGNASGTDDIYNYSSVYLLSGTGAGQLRRVINYNGSTKVLTVNNAFTTPPTAGTEYVIGPNVIIRGDSGATVGTRATAYVANCMGGTPRKIKMISEGSNYSQANAVLVANGSVGTGATARVIISPAGGHGANPVEELVAHNVMMNVKLTGSEANTFPTNNDFRIVGLMRDPVLRGGPVANASVIDQTSRLTVTGLNGDLTADEVVTGSTSGAKARLVSFANTNGARTAGLVRLVNVTTNGTGGWFSVAETITGATSGKTATVAAVTKQAVRPFTGDVIYIENRAPVSRASDQTEDVKLVVRS